MSSSSPTGVRILRGAESLRARPAALAVPPAPASEASAPGTRPVVTSVADQVEAARAEGYAAGYETAMAEVVDSAEARRAEQLARMSDALVAAAASVADGRASTVKVVEAEAVHLAFELAEAIVRRELTLSSCVSVEAVTRALGLVPHGEDVLVRVHPGDVVDPDALKALLPEASVKVVVDPAVEHGGCIVEAGPCRIDAQIGPAIERARALLRQMTEGHGSADAAAPGAREAQ